MIYIIKSIFEWLLFACHQALLPPTNPLRMMIKMAAMLSLSGEIILQFYIKLLMILLGLSSAYNLLYFYYIMSV